MTNDELALRVAREMRREGYDVQSATELARRYEEAKLKVMLREEMWVEVKETITLLRNLAGPDPYDERPTKHAKLLYKAADLIERLATAQEVR